MASILAIADIQLDAPGALQPWEIKDGWRANAWPMRQVSLAVGGVSDWFDPLSYDLPEDIPLPLVTDLSPRRYAVTTAGDSVLVEVPDYDTDVEALLGGDAVKAPMPGKIIAMNVKAGDTVTHGQTLAVMEAMKMEHSLAAPRDGVVEAVSGAVGEQVAEGVVLVQLVEE